MKSPIEQYAEVEAMKPLDVMAFLGELPKVITGAAELVQSLGIETPWLDVLLEDMSTVETVIGQLIDAARERQVPYVTEKNSGVAYKKLSAVLERIA